MKKIFFCILCISTVQGMQEESVTLQLSSKDEELQSNRLFKKRLFLNGTRVASVEYRIFTGSSFPPARGMIERLWVPEDCRRRGFGQLLTIYTIKEIKKVIGLDSPEIIADDVFTDIAKNLFKKLGFAENMILTCTPEVIQRLGKIQDEIETKYKIKE